MSNCTRLTDNNFQAEVLDCPTPVLVDFWGSWCPPCKMMEPVMEELVQRVAGRIKVCKLNVDQHPSFRSLYRVAGVPAFIVFDGGRIVRRAVGAHSLKQLLDLIDSGLAEKIPPRPIMELPTDRAAAGKEITAIAGESKRL